MANQLEQFHLIYMTLIFTKELLEGNIFRYTQVKMYTKLKIILMDFHMSLFNMVKGI